MNSCCFNMFCSNLKPPSEKLVLMIWALEDQSSFEVVCALWLFQRTGQNLSLLCGSRLLGIDMILVLVENDLFLQGSYLKIEDKQVPNTCVKAFTALLHHWLHKYHYMNRVCVCIKINFNNILNILYI